MIQQPAGTGANFSMQQQTAPFLMQPQQTSNAFNMQSSQEGGYAQQSTSASTYCMQPSGNNSHVQEGSDKIIDQLHQFPSNAEDRDFGLEIPE
jgi:hypothetical protein